MTYLYFKEEDTMKIFAAYGAPPLIKGLVRDIRPVWALEELDEPISIEVYLEGELPSNFKRLRTGIERKRGSC